MHTVIYLSTTKKSVTRQNLDFEEIDFVESPPAQFIRHLKSFYKANLDINKPLRLYVII